MKIDWMWAVILAVLGILVVGTNTGCEWNKAKAYVCPECPTWEEQLGDRIGTELVRLINNALGNNGENDKTIVAAIPITRLQAANRDLRSRPVRVGVLGAAMGRWGAITQSGRFAGNV